MVLTPQEVQLFRHNGFVKLPTRLDDDLVAELKADGIKRHSGGGRTGCAQ